MTHAHQRSISRWLLAAILASRLLKRCRRSRCFPYGAVYFRKSNPPEQDWARDHATAARIGMNTFRHWFMWGAIEVAPGKYDWRDYDRMMDLAAKNGIKVVIAEFDHRRRRNGCSANIPTLDIAAAMAASSTAASAAAAPQAASPDCVSTIPKSSPPPKSFSSRWSSITAIIPRCSATICGTRTPITAAARRRCIAIAMRPSASFASGCATAISTLEEAGRVWNRYSYASWDDVEPPPNFGGYSESLDWLQFRIDNAFDLLHWRAELFRKLDPNHLIVAHGVAGTLESLSFKCSR